MTGFSFGGKLITGRLCVKSAYGYSEQRVVIVKATAKRYRIRALKFTRLSGRYRWLAPGEETYVPRTAIKDDCSKCNGRRGGVPGNENIVRGKRVCDYCS